MEKERAIELLIQAVDEIPHLKTLNYQNDEIKLWLDKVENILRAGLKPEDYSKYWPVSQEIEILKGVYEDNIYQEEYLRKITNYEIALKSILLKYEILGMEGKKDKGGEVEMKNLLKDLLQFLDELKAYKEILTNPNSELLKAKRKNELFAAFPFLQDALPKKSKEEVKEEVREKLVLKRGVLKDEIAKLTGRTDIDQFSRTWNRALSPVFGIGENKDALSLCIDYTLEAIGKLESTPLAELESQEAKSVVVESPLEVFNTMCLHPKVVEVSEYPFKTGNYSSAIFEAFKAVHNYVQDKTGLTLEGVNLMEKVFNENKPILQLNELLTKSDRDEQKGFKYLFMGSQMGIRNPQAHENVKPEEQNRALEYLGIASLLMRRIDGSKLVKLNI